MLALRYFWANWYHRKHRHTWWYSRVQDLRTCMVCGRRESTEIEYGR